MASAARTRAPVNNTMKQLMRLVANVSGGLVRATALVGPTPSIPQVVEGIDRDAAAFWLLWR
jgi:hypothetical protein